MAARLEEDLTCSICCDLFRDPLLLSCSHSFCRVCLLSWWKNKAIKTCPVCKKGSSKAPRLNLSLRNLVQTFEEEMKRLSAEEKEKKKKSALKYVCIGLFPFCLMAFLVFRNLSFSSKEKEASLPREKASLLREELREELREDLRFLQEKLKILSQTHEEMQVAVSHIAAQTEQTEKLIGDQFNKLHQFLWEEEETRIMALKEEQQQKTQRLLDKMAAVSRDMETVSRSLSETELTTRRSRARTFLDTALENTTMGQDALIDQAKHLGNLGFHIWKNMQRLVQFWPVILDPNRAASELVVSDNLSSVRRGGTRRSPQNPERERFYTVLGSRAYRVGSHSWEVVVRDSKYWGVGVSGSVEREERTEVGVWGVGFTGDKYTAYSLSQSDSVTHLSVNHLHRVRVKLDFNRNTLTFSDADTHTQLHTFTHNAIELVPFVTTTDEIPLQVSPKDISVLLV
ncbi:unnamed protein product [Knipowitschia caucasica]